MRLEKRSISTIKPYDRNPRIISEKAVKAVANSIEKFGWQQPVVIDTDGVIIAGHTRYRAAKYLNLEEIPVMIADELTPEQARAYRIADNKTAERSAWNFDLLPDEIGEIEDAFDFTLFGFDKDELDKIMGKAVYAREKDPDKIPDEIPPKPVTQPGDVIELGEHRLICGDSTKPETFAALMGDEKADIVITDPPYGVSYKGGPSTPRKDIANDDLTGNVLREFLIKAFTASKAVIREGAAVYIWHASINSEKFIDACQTAGFEYRQMLIWKKSQPMLDWADYLWQHEPCIYAKMPGGGVFWNGGRSEKTVLTDEKDPKQMTEKELRKAYTQALRTLKQYSDVIEVKKPLEAPLHPTTKPTKLYQRLLQNSSRRGDILLDFFGGSGTAVIAAEETRRRARVIELDPHFCDVIVRRWEDYTGLEAKRPAVAPPDAPAPSVE